MQLYVTKCALSVSEWRRHRQWLMDAEALWRHEARRAAEIEAERKRSVVNWRILALMRQWR